MDPSASLPSFATGGQTARGRSQQRVSLQKRTVGEQILSTRHERALAKFNEQQEKWESFRHRAARRTGRAKEDLVVTRAEEYRERLEVMELLERATPSEDKSAGHSWYHSLRGEGTRYVQIGNMFSGLHLPIKLHKEEYVHEIVRKPLLTELIASRSVQSAKHTKRTWRDDEYLQARIRRYRKKMEELAPGRLEMHEMLGPDIVKLGGSPPELSTLTEFPDDGDQVEGEGAELDGFAVAALPSTAGSDGNRGAALQLGPHVEVVPDRLQFSGGVGQLCMQRISILNVGTAGIGYEWVLHEPPNAFQESVLPDDPSRCFACNKTKGRILPGDEVCAVFTFKSNTPGAFTAVWQLRTYPELVIPVGEVQVHGVASEGDLMLERRDIFRGMVFQQQVLHQVEELIEDIVSSVDLRPPELPDLGSQVVQQRIFEEVNGQLGLYYSPHAWERFTAIGKSVDGLKKRTSKDRRPQGPSPQPEPNEIVRGRRPVVRPQAPKAAPHAFPLERGPPAAHVLQADLAKLPTADGMGAALAEVQLDLAREIRSSQKKPLDQSPLWWAAYEAITEAVLALPGQWAAARTAAELKPLPFVPVPEDDAAPEVIEMHTQQLQERAELLGTPEQEEEVRNAFIESFCKGSFGAATARFEAGAKEVSAVTRIHCAAAKTLRERFALYLDRQNIDSVEMGGSVIMYELDLGFLDSAAAAAAASAESQDDGGLVPLPLETADEEQVQRCLRGVNTVLESSPLSVLVTAHLGEPAPAEAQDPSAGPRGLWSTEPLLQRLRDICQEVATTVEFVPLESWLGDVEAFAERVRSEEEERKVFLLENLAAVPEELGFRCVRQEPPPAPVSPPPPPAPTGGGKAAEAAAAAAAAAAALAAEQQPPPEPPGVERHSLAWATREAWAVRTLGGDLRPEFSVLDSFSAACKSITSHEGLWLGAPQRIVGSYIETELNLFCDALHLPFRSSEGEGDVKDVQAVERLGASQALDPARVPAPLLLVLGGGGYTGEGGEERLLLKLELLVGLARLVLHEKDGLLVVLAGELAVCVLRGLFRAQVAAPAPAASSALREALLDALGLDVQLQIPVDFVLETAVPEEPVPADSPPDVQQPLPSTPLAEFFKSRALVPALLGRRDGRDKYAHLDLATGSITLSESSEVLVPAGEAATPSPTSGTPPELPVVRDVGQATREALGKALRRCRGVLWNGVLGMWEEERWQVGTRSLFTSIEGRLAGGGEEEEEEEEEEDEDEEDGEEGEGEDGKRGRSEGSKEEPEPEAEFEVAVVIGRDSTRLLPSLMETPSLVTFASQSGEGLLQVLRGHPVPGLLACGEQTRSH